MVKVRIFTRVMFRSMVQSVLGYRSDFYYSETKGKGKI